MSKLKTEKLTPEGLIGTGTGTAFLVTEPYDQFKRGQIIFRLESVGDTHSSCNFSENADGSGYTDWMANYEVELIVEEPKEPKDDLFRPDVQTRKAGKVRVELVDRGFPFALRELARVMTWAQEAKGYKDHDWLNLPDAEIQLEAAASRHRTDYIAQRIMGHEPHECVDHESAISHKAHEAFGVLAQLEILLRNAQKA